MIGVLIVAVLAMVVVLAGVAVLMARAEPARKARRKDLAAATAAINAVDDLVDRYQPQLDLVGQALAEDIRKTVSQYRKDITHR